MANVSGLLGTAGGYKGTGVDGPMDTVSSAQLEQADQNVAMNQGNQNSLLTALQAQNGLGAQMQNYGQLQGVINGTGPNPAQAQLAQATQANTANQAALMAGQRGSSQNTGLIARQASMQGANNQQQAAGQAATLQAQQSMAGIQAAGNMANTMATNQIGQTNTNATQAQAHQSALLTSTANQNATRQALISGTAQQQAAIGGSSANAAGSAMASVGAEGGNVDEMPKVGTNKPINSGGGGGSGIAGMFKSVMAFMAEGGPVPGSAYPGQSAFGAALAGGVDRINPGPEETWGNDLLKNSGKFDAKKKPSKTSSYSDKAVPTDEQAGNANEASMESAQPQPEQMAPPTSDTVDMGGEAMARGGKVDVLLSPGEKKLSPKAAKAVAHGANPDKVGTEVAPGVKPKVGGAKNSYANDFVKDKVEEGTIILPRSVTQSKHPHWAAMKFVQAHMAKGGLVQHKPKGKK